MNFQSTKRFKSILILDDDFLQARTLRNHLSEKGYRITDTVYSGVDAIKSVENEKPDIVLLDIQLDGQQLDGIDVGRKIHKIDSSITLIYITAFASEVNFQRALSSHPFAFIEKPYSIRTLYRELEMAVRRAYNTPSESETIDSNKLSEPKNRKPQLLCFPDFILTRPGGQTYAKTPISEVLYIEADNVWTTIYTTGKRIILSYNIGNVEKELEYPELFRSHRSYIINLRKISQIELNAGGGHVVINQEKIKVSRSRVDLFWSAWQNLFGSSESRSSRQDRK